MSGQTELPYTLCGTLNKVRKPRVCKEEFGGVVYV